MAYKYRQIKPQTGDIVSPEDFNVNNREYVEEFNGMLDRDNFDKSIFTTKEIKQNAFNKFYSYRAMLPFKSDSNKQFVLDGIRTIWETQDASDTYVSKVEFEAKTDGVLICEWHGNWEFEVSPTSDDGPYAQKPQVISFRMLANGSEIAKSFRNIDAPEKNSGAMFGCYQAPAGNITVIVQARTYRIDGSKITEAMDNATSTVNNRGCFINERELIVNFRKR